MGVGATLHIQWEDYMPRQAAYNLMFQAPMAVETEASEVNSVPMTIFTRTRETPLNISELVNSYRHKRNK